MVPNHITRPADFEVVCGFDHGLNMAEKKSKLVEIKTKQNSASVEDFINSIEDEQKRIDSFTILEIMKKATGVEPKMWGSSIIGFGEERYKSPKTGREVDWFRIGFSPRKANLSLHIAIDLKAFSAQLDRLGMHKTGKGCLYINRLDDVDTSVLQGMIEAALNKRAMTP